MVSVGLLFCKLRVLCFNGGGCVGGVCFWLVLFVYAGFVLWCYSFAIINNHEDCLAVRGSWC